MLKSGCPQSGPGGRSGVGPGKGGGLNQNLVMGAGVGAGPVFVYLLPSSPEWF